MGARRYHEARHYRVNRGVGPPRGSVDVEIRAADKGGGAALLHTNVEEEVDRF
jgi:hypothetical protein